MTRTPLAALFLVNVALALVNAGALLHSVRGGEDSILYDLGPCATFGVVALPIFMHVTYRLDPVRYAGEGAKVAASYALLILMVIGGLAAYSATAVL